MIGMTPGRIVTLIGIAAEAANALLEAGIGDFRLLEVLHHREHNIGGAGREVLTSLGAAGLEHQRLTLRTAAGVEGTLDGKVRTFVVERLDLAFVKELAGLEIGNDGLVAPAIPQAAHHIDEFFRDLVAQLVVWMRAAEVAAGGGRRGRDRVPGRPAAADVIQRCENARNRVGIAVGRRHGRGETNMRRRHRQRREQRQRLQAASIGWMVAQIGGQAVAQKQEVEQPPFGDGRHTLEHLDVEKGLVGAGIAPTGGVIASSEQKDAKVDRPWHDCTFKRQGLRPRRETPVSSGANSGSRSFCPSARFGSSAERLRASKSSPLYRSKANIGRTPLCPILMSEFVNAAMCASFSMLNRNGNGPKCLETGQYRWVRIGPRMSGSRRLPCAISSSLFFVCAAYTRQRPRRCFLTRSLLSIRARNPTKPGCRPVSAQYMANKATNGNDGLVWQHKGAGY